MRKSLLPVLSALFLMPLALKGQNYAIEILPDSQVIYVDKLGLPGTTTLEELLHMVPELLNRDASDFFSYYDIQYDGKSTREGRDVILNQTRLSELEKVEITSSPTVTQQKNGQGGVVNIIPKKLDEGLTGDASLAAATLGDVMPGVNVNFKKEKLELRTSLNLEYYSPESLKPSTTIFSDKTVYSVDTLRQRYCQETAKVNMKYNFSKNDELKVWMLESWMRGRSSSVTSSTMANDMTSKMGPGWIYLENGRKTENLMRNIFSVTTMGEYEHTFENSSSLDASIGYEYQKEKFDQYEKSYYSTLTKPHSLSSELKYSTPLVKNENHDLKLETGANLNYEHSYSATQEGGNVYASPFVNFKYKTGQWTVHAGARYQCYMREYTVQDKDHLNDVDHDFTYNLNAVWQIAPHHSIRFLSMRNLMRPTDAQLYPVMTFDILQNMWTKGNEDLKTQTVHTFEANYVHDWSGNGHHLVFNAKLGYDRCDNLIEKKIKGGEASGSSMGLTLLYYTFENTGVNNILKTDVGLFYSYGIFSMAFSGNMFCNFINMGGVPDRYTNFNFSLSPIFHFKKQWVLSSDVIYNGPVYTKNSDLGDCFYMRISLNKTIRKWTLSAVLSDVFDYVSTDETRNADSIYRSQYDMYQRYVSFGATYRF